MGRRSLFPVAAFIALLLSAVGPASASQATDPNDVSGKLDLKLLTGTKADPTAPLRIELRTYGPWKKGALCECGNDRLFILFNVDADPKIEYVGEISESGGKLHMDISGQGSSFEPLPVTRPDDHTIRTVVPGGSPPNPDGTVKIAARSRYGGIVDRAPNGGWLAVS